MQKYFNLSSHDVLRCVDDDDDDHLNDSNFYERRVRGEGNAPQGGNSQNFLRNFVIFFCNFKVLLRSSYS